MHTYNTAVQAYDIMHLTTFQTTYLEQLLVFNDVFKGGCRSANSIKQQSSAVVSFLAREGSMLLKLMQDASICRYAHAHADDILICVHILTATYTANPHVCDCFIGA